MAAKKATKKKSTKKATTKKTVAKKTKVKSAKADTSKKKTKVKASTTKVKSKAKSKDETETPSTLAVKAKKKTVKKKRLTKKQVAEQTERDELTEKWAKLKDIDHEVKAQKYKMSEAYAPNTPIDHPMFGWGFVLSLNENKLEVLFESGIKMLVSNYSN